MSVCLPACIVGMRWDNGECWGCCTVCMCIQSQNDEVSSCFVCFDLGYGNVWMDLFVVVVDRSE